MITRFEEVQDYGTKSGKCEHCGGYAQRSKTFTQTINPFNKKAEQDIRMELAEAVAEWEAQPAVHDKCERAVAGLPPKFNSI